MIVILEENMLEDSSKFIFTKNTKELEEK